MMRVAVLLILAVLALALNAQEQPNEQLWRSDMGVPMKRFYSWEDAKRSEPAVKELMDKRKQFYAWAGKRFDPSMEKRKQFYAWAGR